MARLGHNNNNKNAISRKVVFLLSCAALLGVALIADFLWALSTSTSSAYQSIASNWALGKSGSIIVPSFNTAQDDKVHCFDPLTLL